MASITKYTNSKGSFWQVRAFIGYREDGRELRLTKKGFNTKKEAQKALNQAISDYETKKTPDLQVKLTFKELYDIWLEQYRLSVKPSSVATAKRYCELHVLPAFGHLKLDKITVAYCQKQVNTWHSKYKQYNYLRKETQKIMKFGVSSELMDSNPMSKVIVPRKKEVDMPIKFYTKDQLIDFLNFAKSICNPKIYTFIRLLTFTGMRKSEALALQWKDINFSSKTLNIGKTVAIDEFKKVILQEPKTINSTRIIKLDEGTISQLESWKSDQEKQLKLLKVKPSDKQHIFTGKENNLYYPQIINDWLNWIYHKDSKKLFHKITPHGFRYTHCSLLFESGASIKEVQSRLGHKDVQTTLNIYACTTPQMIENTGEKFANYINF